MKGHAPSYDELMRQLEAERFAPPPAPTPPASERELAKERLRALYEDTVAYEHGKAQALRATS